MPDLDFETIFRTYNAFAWRVLARHGVADGDLPDLCQEVFVVVHRSLAQFEGRSRLRTWLYGICRNVASNHRRRAVVRREVPSDSLPEPEPDLSQAGDPLAALSQKESLARLEQQLAALTAEQREVFVLYEIEELSMREVAEALECSQNTAYSRLYAAREQIRKGLCRRDDWRVA